MKFLTIFYGAGELFLSLDKCIKIFVFELDEDQSKLLINESRHRQTTNEKENEVGSFG